MTRNPFDEIERMFDRMSRQFETFDEDLFEGSVAVDVEDVGDSYVVTADLPGYSRDDINVEIAGRTLTVSADYDEADETGEEGRYIRRERQRRSTSRSVRLPEEVDEAKAEAEYNNGVLTVTLSKLTDSAGRDIPIN